MFIHVYIFPCSVLFTLVKLIYIFTRLFACMFICVAVFVALYFVSCVRVCVRVSIFSGVVTRVCVDASVRERRVCPSKLSTSDPTCYRHTT